MRGEIVRLQMYDIGGSLDVATLKALFAARGTAAGPSIGKGTPGYVEFPHPVSVSLPDLPLDGPLGATSAQVIASYFPIGAISFRLRLSVDVPSVDQLSDFAHTRFQVDGKWLAADEACRRLLEKERSAWEPAVKERYTSDIPEEYYTIYTCHGPGAEAAEFYAKNQRRIAGLLKGERGERLHEKEIREGTRSWFSYYSDDLVVVDWDSALIMDPAGTYEDLVFVLEIANLQLLQFRAYDKYLDTVLARAYDELERVHSRPMMGRARRTAHELQVARMEIAELADEADNITKFLGDWFLARVYQAAQERLHLPAWRASVDEKLATLHQLYQIAVSESDSRRMVVLEVLIVLLFILDVILLFLL